MAKGVGMSDKRFTEKFKIAAVKQVAQRGHPVSEVAEPLGVNTPRAKRTWVRVMRPPIESTTQSSPSNNTDSYRLNAALH